ncbi:MAG: hypothetical protein U1U88_002225 [Lawsonella clevelandensis]
MPFITRTFTLEGDTMPALLGAHDANLRELENSLAPISTSEELNLLSPAILTIPLISLSHKLSSLPSSTPSSRALF